ncbi:MAG: hypothetical protein L6Q66_06410 [Bacteroidia bacterium]|nr:hypothetical protein [Bacteroidia bacterium]
MNEIIIVLISSASGGILWEVIKLFYPDLKRPISSRIAAKKSFYENLDPLLKSASELFGKLESLAKEDFSSFINTNNSNSKNPEHNRKYVYYLFAQFWAQLEYIRLKSQYTSLAKIKKGEELLRFIETIESRKYRILDRSIQRIIGESLIAKKNQKFKIMTLNEFLVELDEPNSNLAKWINELELFLMQVSDKDKRQTVLRFGVILSALIDNFDPKHETVRRRQLYTNKLSLKSKNLIRNNLLDHYLKFIDKKEIYYKK